MADRRSLRGALFTALTGRTGDVAGDPAGDVVGMLMAVGGPSARTRSGIDLTAAGRALGVSRRTVERWVRAAATGQGQRPSPGHARALARRARQAATTKAGRRAALAGSAARQAVAQGARLSITGVQGPISRDYMRQRVTTLDLDPADADAMLTAWENGGDKGFLAWASSHWDQQYVDDWRFGDVDAVSLETPFGGEWR